MCIKKAGSLSACLEIVCVKKLDVGFGLTQTLNAIALFPEATLLEERNALETLQNVAFQDDTGGTLEAFVL